MGANAGLNILLVEDDAAQAAMYRIKLAHEGHRVEIAPDGETGLHAALAQPPDLLLVDVRLPGIDGLTLLEQLRRDASCAMLPAIILSNFDNADLTERTASLGVRAQLIKSQTTPGCLARMIAELALSPRAEVAGG